MLRLQFYKLEKILYFGAMDILMFALFFFLMQIQGLYLLIIHVHGHYIMFMDPIFLLFSAYDGERRKKPLSGP